MNTSHRHVITSYYMPMAGNNNYGWHIITSYYMPMAETQQYLTFAVNFVYSYFMRRQLITITTLTFSELNNLAIKSQRHDNII